MASVTFMKNFKVTEKDSDAFVKFMNEPSKPLFSDNFKSKLASVNDDKDLFEKALSSKQEI